MRNAHPCTSLPCFKLLYRWWYWLRISRQHLVFEDVVLITMSVDVKNRLDYSSGSTCTAHYLSSYFSSFQGHRMLPSSCHFVATLSRHFHNLILVVVFVATRVQIDIIISSAQFLAGCSLRLWLWWRHSHAMYLAGYSISDQIKLLLDIWLPLEWILRVFSSCDADVLFVCFSNPTLCHSRFFFYEQFTIGVLFHSYDGNHVAVYCGIHFRPFGMQSLWLCPLVPR